MKINKNGLIVEIAPGYEPKIGNALALLGFEGRIILVEPDSEAAEAVLAEYKTILPRARVEIVSKSMQDLDIGQDIPLGADALIASHPFDDMVISSITDRPDLFSRERDYGADMSSSISDIYKTLRASDYARGVSATVSNWKKFIGLSKPKVFIASQYPSRTLTQKGLHMRQRAGFIVLNRLKRFYKRLLVGVDLRDEFGTKGSSRWWIAVKMERAVLSTSCKPRAMKRLGDGIFVPELMRRLGPSEYDTIYFDKQSFSVGSDCPEDLAVVLDISGDLTGYSDRQKDSSNIGLSGNLGSGRAVYYGEEFNILGVGKTSLCKSTRTTHSNGELEMIGAMRRVVMSRWINYFTKRAPIHPLLFALKTTTNRKWSPEPIPLALLVRVDRGAFDRPSHVEQSPEIKIDFDNVLSEYARLDAEYFAYRFMLGAWSTSNYSLKGDIIDLESASFVKYRGLYHTSSSKYPHNRFGNEGLGFIRILRQLAYVKGLDGRGIAKRFYRERYSHMGFCLLSLLGLDKNSSKFFFEFHRDQVLDLSERFERLSRMTAGDEKSLSLYSEFADEEDPALFDMSRLFRSIAEIEGLTDANEQAFKLLVRRSSSEEIDRRDGLFFETKLFIRDLLRLLDLFWSEGYVKDKKDWDYRLKSVNQDLPPMYELNRQLKILAESYRLCRMSPRELGIEIENICMLPCKGKSS